MRKQKREALRNKGNIVFKMAHLDKAPSNNGNKGG